jgi:hypothetical protein
VGNGMGRSLVVGLWNADDCRGGRAIAEKRADADAVDDDDEELNGGREGSSEDRIAGAVISSVLSCIAGVNSTMHFLGLFTMPIATTSDKEVWSSWQFITPSTLAISWLGR